MDDARLKYLLRRADGGAEATAIVDAAGIAGAVVRQRRTRQVRARTAGVAVALLAVIAGGVWYSLVRPAPPAPTVARAPAVQDHAEADRLAQESAAFLALARRAEAAERLDRARAAAASLRAAIESERERAATVMVQQGDWLRRRGQSGDAEYRRTISLFAGTRAASEARARLGQG